MQERLRIIQVVNVRWFNATAWYGLSLAALLRDAGHEVLVFALEHTDAFARSAGLGLETRHLPNVVNPLLVRPLLKQMNVAVRSFKPHIVNCHRGEGMLFWGLLKKGRLPFALVRTRGDQRPPKKNFANKILHAGLADAVIATNSRTAVQCRDSFGLDSARLFTIPGGVDTARFAPDPAGRKEVRAKLGFADDDMVLGLVGRFDPVKGQQELVASLRRVRKHPEMQKYAGRIRLLLLGLAASIDVKTVEGWIAGAGLAGSAVVSTRVDNVAAYINAMDLGVVASQGSEAIARAAFEIMACGVPLVGTNVGVMPDLLAGHALMPPGDAEAMDALLLRAVADHNFRRELAGEQRHAIKCFSQQAFLRQTLAVYQAALGLGGP